MANAKAIGELNGKWAFLIKMFLATWPVLLMAHIAFATWMVNELRDFRIFQAEAAIVHNQLMAEVHRH